MRVPRLALGILAGFALAASGCVSSTDVSYSFTALGWSDRLRPDLEPLEPRQQRQSLDRFVDGRPNGQGLVSPLYPDTPEGRDGSMPAAPVLWIGQGTPLRLSYEVVVFRPRLNGQPMRVTDQPYGGSVGPQSPGANQAAISARGATLPSTRQWLALPESLGGSILAPDQLQGSWTLSVPFGVALESCTDGLAVHNRDSPPEGLTRRCARPLVDSRLCGSSSDRVSLLPWTVVGCRFVPDQDVSFRLRVVDARAVNRTGVDLMPNTAQHAAELRPHVKVVAQPRTLLREAGTIREECRAPGATGERDCTDAERANLRLWRHCNGVPQTVPPGTSFGPCQSWLGWDRQLSPPGFTRITRLWSFSVADPATGQWRENFASGLRIRRIRFVLINAATPNRRRYLNLNDGTATGFTELRALVAGPGGPPRCDITAEPGTGDAIADPTTCRTLFGSVSNPAWLNGSPERPVEWRLVFQEPGADVEVAQSCRPLMVCTQVADRRVCRPEPRCTPVMAQGVLTRDIAIRPESGDRLFLEFEMEAATGG